MWLDRTETTVPMAVGVFKKSDYKRTSSDLMLWICYKEI